MFSPMLTRVDTRAWASERVGSPSSHSGHVGPTTITLYLRLFTILEMFLEVGGGAQRATRNEVVPLVVAR